jgi:hypothetical protein
MKKGLGLLLVAGALAAAVLAAGAGSASAAMTPNVLYGGGDPGGDTYKGNVNGYTHCFVTWSHAGCQMNHNLSKEIVVDTAGGAVGVAVGILCTAITGSPAAGYGCGFFLGALTTDVLNRINVMPYGDCLEVGEGIVPLYNLGIPYAAVIPCTVE